MSALTHQKLWEHEDPTSTRTYAFKKLVEDKYNVQLEDYESLRQWSVSHLAQFWEEVWYFTGIRASTAFTKVVYQDALMFPRPAFFEGAKLNFAENLLFPACNPKEDSFAVIAATEDTRNSVTWKELRENVRQCASAMRSAGVEEGDRVAGYVANHTNALIAMLSATSIGALWTAISPDTGVHAVLDRIVQIEPVLLFVDNGVTYNGKTHDVHNKLRDIAKELPTLRVVVIFETIKDHPFDLTDISIPSGKLLTYATFLAFASAESPLKFSQLPPDHPIYILYSSGTTGKPKCIVHGAIGTLIQHKKEHDIQCSIRPGDRLFYFTTCTWMMWHWLVSGLATGATIILYDGSPFRYLSPSPSPESKPDTLAMPRLISELSITHFGTSAKYLSILEQKTAYPKTDEISTSTLKAIYSTGSPLSASTFSYVYAAFGPALNLASITGGTDIISLFGAPSQISPVYAGEVQVRGLGMAVEVFDPSLSPSSTAKNITSSGDPGDLVCVRPFPCQPVMFWPPGPEGEDKYRRSYFETWGPAVWHHGDFVRVNSATGGMLMLGRSDGVLKPAGVRFGSAEIYNVLLAHFPEVEDALCIGRRREADQDETVVLFVKMAEGAEAFGEGLRGRVKEVVRRELSARHVPGVVDACEAIPVTTNGKKVEVAVKQILCGMKVRTSASVANAECLEWFRRWNEEHP
ncbi:MAG: hypothetical protein Q9195_009581 [Heterodermia aff. obscurata]